MSALAEFAGAVRSEVADGARARRPERRIVLFGHVGDGNLHVNMIGPDPDDHRGDDAVLRMVIERRRLHQCRARDRHREARLRHLRPLRR